MTVTVTSSPQSSRNHPAYWAFIGHRISGICLALFLPAHFIMLGLAFEGADRFDAALAFTDLPLVKIAEWGLVVFLALHLFFGLRILALELLPWRGDGSARLGMVALGVCGAGLVGLVFAFGAVGVL